VVEKKTTEKKENPLKAQVEALMKKAGADGISAEALAKNTGLITDKTEAVDITVAKKKIRVVARSIVGGATTKRDGRSAIYVHPEFAVTG